MPYALGQKLFDAAPSKEKTFCTVDGAGHGELDLTKPTIAGCLGRFFGAPVPAM